MKIISIGEVLWDVIGNTEHPGGAPFNFAIHARQLGHEVCFISAIGKDQRGQQILEKMAEFDLPTRFMHSDEAYPTGIVTVSIDSTGQPDYTIHRPAAYDFPVLDHAEKNVLLSPEPDWIYFGTLQQTSKQAHDLTLSLINSFGRARRFYDVNLRRDCYTPKLVHELMTQTTVLKLNSQEAVEIATMLNDSFSTLENFCQIYAERFKFKAICVTRGDQGCAIYMNDHYTEFLGYPVAVVDTVGAGDAFAAAFVHGFAMKWEPARIADFANCVGALVAGRPGATPRWTIKEALQLMRKE